MTKKTVTVKAKAIDFMQDLYEAPSKKYAFILMDEYASNFGYAKACENLPFGAAYWFSTAKRYWLLKRRINQWIEDVKTRTL